MSRKNATGETVVGRMIRSVKLFFYNCNTALYHRLHRKPPKSATPRNRRVKSAGFVVAMLAIPVANFLIFYVYANFSSILLAFQRIGADGKLYLTWENFRQVFQSFTAQGDLINQAVKNTLIFFVFNTAVLLPLSLFLSFFLYKKILLKQYFRFMFFVPSIISGVVMTTTYKFLLAPDGPVGILYKQLTGADTVPAFFAMKEYAMKVTLLYMLWTGFCSNLLLLGGAMARIPEETVEAALLDGVGMWREMFQITLPMIWPTLSTIIIVTASSVLSSSGPILLLTGGGGETYDLAYYIYDQVQMHGRYNVPAALGLTLTVVTFPIVMLVRFLVGKVYADVEF